VYIYYLYILPALSQIAAMRQELEALKRKSREDEAEIERLR
jgi:cell division protein FtsB